MADTQGTQIVHHRRVYPLDAHELSEEQIAVTFAMTSRRPEPFDEIAQQVSLEKAAEFNERWVLGYGHASVAEHAVLHLAVENISRVACDALEDNRLASFTEKSSRYQVMAEDYFHVPQELASDPGLSETYREACHRLFEAYFRLIDGTMEHLRSVHPQRDGERDNAYTMRLRRDATDSSRAILPAATLTNVGVTANARVLEHAISKLMSSEVSEERELGEELRRQGQSITPTLIKYADRNTFLSQHPDTLGEPADLHGSHVSIKGEAEESVKVSLAHRDAQAEEKLAAALLYRHSQSSYEEIWRRVLDMGSGARQEIIRQSVAGLGPHDAPVREFEVVDYTFEFLLDYGAFREFKRHRMQTYLPQELGVLYGYRVPDLVREAGLEKEFDDGIAIAEEAYPRVYQHAPQAAQYLVTHAHYRRLIAKINLRECYHLFKLRSSHLAHFSIREPTLEAMKLAVEAQPAFFEGLRLRDYPEWWPFTKPADGQ